MTAAAAAVGVRRARAAPVAALVLVAALLSACGDTTSSPQWVAAHPDTSLFAFQTTAPGVCAITVQYPNDAPATIVYLGNTYVQVQRRPHTAAPQGRDLGQSGDWHVLLQGGGDLLLVTPGDAFDYRLEATC